MRPNQKKLTNSITNIVLVIILCIFGFRIITQNDPWQFYDFVNLFVHEAGHIFFIPFGDLMQFLGGTILQISFPIIFCVYFYFKNMFTGVAFCLFWLGENLVNVAYYMKDAVKMQLDLVGGGIHDWNWIFSHFGMLDKYLQVANFTKSLGLFFILLSIVTLVYLIFRNINLRQ